MEKQHGFIFSGSVTIPEDTYFIRRKKDGFYLKYGGEWDKDNVHYLFEEGMHEACGWHLKKGRLFLKMLKLRKVAELVKWSEVIKHDGTKN